MLWGGAVPGMHLWNRCLRKGNSGGLSRQNMTVQPISLFSPSNTMSVLLTLPLSADICNAFCIVTHHWKDRKSLVDVIASLINHYTPIWSIKHVFGLFTGVTTPLFNSNSWCLKSNPHEGWWGISSLITCCCLLPANMLIRSTVLTEIPISCAHWNFKTHRVNQLKHSRAVTVSMVSSCRLDISCVFQNAS